MNKNILTLLVVAVIAIIGYMVFGGGAPAAGDTMPDGTQPAGEAMNDDDSMVGGDAKVDGEVDLPDENTMMEDEKMEEDEDDLMMEEKKMEEEKPSTSAAVYTAYSDGVIGNGETSVLFFHAAWCPSCRTGDKELAAIYGSGDATVSTYKIDYDNSDELKAKYGVTYQHTFVLIDGNGNAIKTVQGATGGKLKELVNS